MATRVGDPSARSPYDVIVLVFGIVYVAVGALGFTVTSGVPFAAESGKELLGIFEVNPLHNLVHIAIGAVLILGFLAGHRPAMTMAGIIGAAYLLLGIVGPFLSGDANFLALNTADHFLHIGTAVILLVVAIAGTRATAGRGPARAPVEG